MLATAASSGLGASASSRENNSPSVPPRLCGEQPDPIRKFVIVADDAGHEHPLVFSRQIQHSTVVPRGMRAVSAGFLTIHNGRVIVWDRFESESLHLKPRPQDQQFLESFLAS